MFSLKVDYKYMKIFGNKGKGEWKTFYTFSICIEQIKGVLSQIENQKYDVILMIHPLYKAVARAGRKQKAPAYTIPNRLPGNSHL
jgi:hypothetical protein